MKVSIEHLAQLARLSLSGDEQAVFSGQIDRILDYMDMLNELDTSDVEPTSHIIALDNVMRDDILEGSLSREDALMNAPDHTEAFYRVPRIIE